MNKTKQTISGLIQYGVELIRNNKVDLDTLISSDRLMIEIYYDDTISETKIDNLNKVYCQYENHIHDTIEALIYKQHITETI